MDINPLGMWSKTNSMYLRYLELLDLHGEASKKLRELLPPTYLTPEELLEWIRNPENTEKMHDQIHLVEQIRAELNEAWHIFSQAYRLMKD